MGKELNWLKAPLEICLDELITNWGRGLKVGESRNIEELEQKLYRLSIDGRTFQNSINFLLQYFLLLLFFNIYMELNVNQHLIKLLLLFICILTHKVLILVL